MKSIHLIPLLCCAISAMAGDTIQIQSAITRTTSKSVYLRAFRDVSTEPGQQVTTTVDEDRLTIVPTIDPTGNIHIESTFTEHMSAPDAKAIKLPAVSTPSGKKATVTVGTISFDFTPTIRHDRK